MLRAGFGLLSLLVVAAIIFYISFGGKNGGYEGQVLQQGKVAREQASQISGRTIDDVPISSTIRMESVEAGGQFRRLKVLSINPGTPMETAYGLKPNDEITKIDGMGVADNNDPELAKAEVYESYQRNQPLTILRNGQEMTLTPNTPLSQMRPDLFGKPGTVLNPNGPLVPAGPAIPNN